MVWDLYEKGIIREIYFGQEEHNAHIIMECENKEVAQTVLADLPLVKNKLIEFELTTLGAYTGFSRLFLKS
jgi:muconolactone delta-isomerase